MKTSYCPSLTPAEAQLGLEFYRSLPADRETTERYNAFVSQIAAAAIADGVRHRLLVFYALCANNLLSLDLHDSAMIQVAARGALPDLHSAIEPLLVAFLECHPEHRRLCGGVTHRRAA